MFVPSQELGPAGETAISSDPLPGAPPPKNRPLALADTAASGPNEQHSSEDSLSSGKTLHSDSVTTFAGKLPQKIGRFLVLRQLGAGGMGVVVEAYDPELNRKVAIKLLRSQRARTSQSRLLREAQAMARVSHPNVVHVYDVGLVDDQVFIAMELVDGHTLAEWLAAEARPWPEVVARFIEAAHGLAAAHSAGLVHRDFKPDNVLLAHDGRVRVADFGLAREGHEPVEVAEWTLEDNPGERPLLANTLTATGVLMGTPMYMSPEQHLGEEAGIASDIFSFSVALFEGIYGTRPFDADTMSQLTRRVLNAEIVPPPSGKKIPAWLDKVVRRGLAVDPRERWPDFPSYLEALQADPGRLRRRLFGGGALVLCAALVGGLVQTQNAPEICTGGTQTIAELWGPEAKTEVRTQLATLPEHARAAVESRVLDGLNNYAETWVRGAREACLDHKRGEHTDLLFDAQGRCLDLRQRAFGRAIKLIREGDPKTLREATMIVAKLPPLAACEDRSALLAEVPPPSDPNQAATVVAIRGKLAELEVDASAGAVVSVLDELDTLRGEAQALAYRPLLAEIDLQVGRLALDAQAWERSSSALASAFIHATAAGADDLAAEAKARQLFLLGRADPARALEERAHARALVERLDGREDLEALLSNNLGAVMAMGGDLEGARAHIRAALELAGDDPRIRPIDLVSGYMLNLAALSDNSEERRRLYEQALTILEGSLGPEHPTVTQSRFRAGLLAGDPARAQAFFTPTCAALLKPTAATAYEMCFECHHRLGHVLVDLGRNDDAAEVTQTGLTCFDRPIAEEEREVVAAYQALLRGRKHLYAGEYEQSEAPLAEARRIFTPHGENWWIGLLLADIDLADGRRLLASGAPQAAIQPLEAAVKTFGDILSQALDDLPRYGRARAQVALAEALLASEAPPTPPAPSPGPSTQSRRERAVSLISEAETYYSSGGPSYAARLAELTNWRRDNLETTSP